MKWFLWLLLVLILPSAGATERKNVLLLCVDDLRPVLGCYGGKAKTPHLDKLTESATVFHRHYVQWPVCGPSRSSMLGGLRPDTTGIYELGDSWAISKRPDSHPTLTRHFRDQSYHTLGFGKVYHGKGKGDGYGWSEPPWKLDWSCYVDFPFQQENKDQWRPAVEIYEGPDSKHNDYQTANKVIGALRKHQDKPFFIAGGFYKPHLPLVAPQQYWDLYSEEEITRIDPLSLPSGAGDFMYAWSEISSYGRPDGTMFANDADVNEAEARRMIHAYYACVSFIDELIGRILAVLDETGLAKNTGVVIWGDHGFHLGDHGRWAKHTQFEQAMRSLLIVRLPGHQQVTGPSDALVESVDIYPTLCEFAGLHLPEFLEGRSLVPVLAGGSPGKEAAFSQIRPVNRKEQDLMAYSVRTADFRYVEWRDSHNGNSVVHRELYDHRNDPEETMNVSDLPELASVVSRLEELVLANYGSLK